MSNIYQIHQARMISDLKNFRKKGSVNKGLQNYLTDYGIAKKDFYEYMDGVDKDEVRTLYKILVDVSRFHTQHTADTDLQLRYDIEDVYYTITNNLRTLDQRYKFPSILIKYRQGINPVRALYFEIAECRINFDLSNASHRFVYDIFLQEHFFPQLRLDIEYDIISLQKLEQRYIDIKTNYPFFTYPLSYYHVQEMIKDFKKWGDVYKDFNENIIKELKRKYD
jgi:hypothetical protein|tara:strand:+ start:2407 stop:3075 length:669 start_codon:yes stop_codon:yes gene_type:complete